MKKTITEKARVVADTDPSYKEKLIEITKKQGISQREFFEKAITELHQQVFEGEEEEKIEEPEDDDEDDYSEKPLFIDQVKRFTNYLYLDNYERFEKRCKNKGDKTKLLNRALKRELDRLDRIDAEKKIKAKTEDHKPGKIKN